VKPIKDMSPEELAAFVCQSLGDAGIKVTLTGGACVAIWTAGQYVSKDLDFIEQGMVPRREVKAVLARLGFTESRRYFTHPDTEFVVEFPSGPLAVGNEPVKSIAERVSSTGVLRLLSPSDCVKDRLAAYFHWNDQQALKQAVLVARSQPIDVKEVRRWSMAEGEAAKFEQFLAALPGSAQ
jgi:hypothetical protein